MIQERRAGLQRRRPDPQRFMLMSHVRISAQTIDVKEGNEGVCCGSRERLPWTYEAGIGAVCRALEGERRAGSPSD